MNNLSLFTGSGIGDLATSQCEIKTVAMCENDPACQYVLRRLWPDAHLFEDVHDVTTSTLRDYMPIDIISGGFPCTDLSCAGRGAGIEGSRSGLWREMFRVIRQVRSTWLLIENVPAIRLRGVDRVLAPLARIGYTCWPLVVGAWAVGAPHKRDRMWIVGRLGDATEARRTTAGTESFDSQRSDSDAWWRFSERQSCLAGTGGLADTIGQLRGGGSDQPERGSEGGIAVGGTGEAMADDNKTGTNRLPIGTQPAYTSPGICRWPSRPGEPQHEYESPRLVKCGVGGTVDGVAPRVFSRANKAALRILGNGWCYPLAVLFYKWIQEMDGPGKN